MQKGILKTEMENMRKMDKSLFLMIILYSILGLVIILSASSVSAVLRYKVSSYYFFIKQLIFVVFGLLVGLVIINIPTSKYKWPSYLLMGLTLSLLTAVLFIGFVSNNAQSWFRKGIFSYQPVELAKPALIFFMAEFYNYQLRKQKKNLYFNLIPLVVAGIIFILVAMQPDLGGALIIGGMAFLIFMTLPLEKQNQLKLFKVIGVAVVITGVALLYSGTDLLNSRQLSRLQFKNPCTRYAEETGYQVCNGFIAIHNGGLFGVGLGNSSQKYLYLPEAHTDFIFPILVEELGALAGVLVLLGYIFILYRILKIGKEANGNIRNQILCYGTFAYIFLHLMVNLMGVLALIPLTGVPIPFLTYGGSYALSLTLMLFVVERVAIENKKAKYRKEIASLSKNKTILPY
ncbi:MAG: FtsW/RodA/SpoVE family cell cycle protein [Bacilli bacterium]|nr:FtsW/RodA/SpoVE family cell cycle protein [Bacilli bacterium]